MVEILFVDDEPRVLEAIQRTLRRTLITPVIAESAAEALAIIDRHEEFPVVVSDYRMPECDGVEFFKQLQQVSPDTSRILLTGQTEQETAQEAVNEGRVFRFMTKPYDQRELIEAIEAGITAHQSARADRELNEALLAGVTGALIEVLREVNPAAFRRARRLRSIAWDIAFAHGTENAWEVELVAMLSQLGQIYVAPEVTAAAVEGQPLPPDGVASYRDYPRRGADLLGRIPRLDSLAESVQHHTRWFDGGGGSGSLSVGEAIPEAARILKIACDLDALMQQGLERDQALASMQRRDGEYDPSILDDFANAGALEGTPRTPPPTGEERAA